MATIRATRRVIKADDDVDYEEIPEETQGEILFETNDVAELLAEVTGEDVEVTIDDEGTGEVTFGVGDTDYTVSPEEGAEEVTSARRVSRSSRSVRASKSLNSRKSYSTRTSSSRPTSRSTSTKRR